MRQIKRPAKSHSFFSRMLLTSAILLSVFSVITSIIVSYLSHQYEKAQFLKTYDLAERNIYDVMENRFEDFHILARKILIDRYCNPDLCTLLEASSFDKVPASTRSNCINLLSEICMDNRYLQCFLIYSSVQDQLYYYGNAQSYLSYAEDPSPIEQIAPFSGSTLDTDTVRTLLEACNVYPSGSFYGIAATLYRSSNKPLGYLIPLYSASEFTNILSNFDLVENCAFTVTGTDGSVYFNSNPDFAPDPDSYYTAALTNRKYQFQVTYYVTKFRLPQNSFTKLILLLAVLVTLFSFALYSITNHMTNRHVNRILDGMNRFSLDNLSYRISLPAGRNEFTQIIERFNAMCDELQKNVERAYVYELQQKKSELYALQTSINPHFLYNTLEMIRVQILNSKQNEASQMILLLSRIYRTQTNTNMFVTLADEVELCENLMILYQYRFRNFDYEFDLDEQLESYALPKNSLQPLIENYFVHGIASDRQDNLILLRVTSFREAGRQYIRLRLCNNGRPILQERLEELSAKLESDVYSSKDTAGFALTNVYCRMKIAFQEGCRIRIDSGDDDMNFGIELSFPAMTMEQIGESFS